MGELTDKQIARLEALASNATEAPWQACADGDILACLDGPDAICLTSTHLMNTPITNAQVADAALIAALRNALPDLLATITAGRERERRLYQSTERFVRYWWEQHQPDERDRERARARLNDPEIRAVLDALADDAASEVTR